MSISSGRKGRVVRFSTQPPALPVALLVWLLVAGMLLIPAPSHAAPAAGPVPTVTLSAPAEAMIGENLSFSVAFSNSSATAPGYGPYIDLVFPVTGSDGAGVGLDDGIDFVSATYLGAPVMTTQLTFPGPGPTGCVSHPYAVDNTGAAVQVCGTSGDKLVVLQLPYGSFTPGQPPAELTINATMSNLADLGTALTIQGRGGFQYGADPLANPTTDPSIVSSFVSGNVTPQLLTLTKSYVGPEDETATGPNYPRQYVIAVNIANGQTINNLDLTDVLPNNLQFVQVDSTTIRGTATATIAVATQHDDPGRHADAAVRLGDGYDGRQRRDHDLHLLRAAEQRGGQPGGRRGHRRRCDVDRRRENAGELDAGRHARRRADGQQRRDDQRPYAD